MFEKTIWAWSIANDNERGDDTRVGGEKTNRVLKAKIKMLA